MPYLYWIQRTASMPFSVRRVSCKLCHVSKTASFPPFLLWAGKSIKCIFQIRPKLWTCIHTRVSWGPILPSISCACNRKIPLLWSGIISLVWRVQSLFLGSAHYPSDLPQLIFILSLLLLLLLLLQGSLYILKSFLLTLLYVLWLSHVWFPSLFLSFAHWAAEWILLLARKPPRPTLRLPSTIWTPWSSCCPCLHFPRTFSFCLLTPLSLSTFR